MPIMQIKQMVDTNQDVIAGLLVIALVAGTIVMLLYIPLCLGWILQLFHPAQKRSGELVISKEVQDFYEKREERLFHVINRLTDHQMELLDHARQLGAYLGHDRKGYFLEFKNLPSGENREYINVEEAQYYEQQ